MGTGMKVPSCAGDYCVALLVSPTDDAVELQGAALHFTANSVIKYHSV